MSKHKLYIVITPFFPTPESFRGPFVYDQVRAIEHNSDFKVLVFVPMSKFRPQGDYEYGGIHVYRFPTIEMPSMLFNGLTNGINASSFIKKIYGLGINLDDIAIVHGHTAMFSIYSLALKRINPSIISIVQHHDPDPFGIRSGRMANWGINARFKARTALKLFKQIDVHICVSKYVQNNLKSFPNHSSFDVDNKYLSILKKVKGLSTFIPKKTLVLYNGVDTDIFYPNPIAHENFIVGCIANIGDWKDQITLLKAIKILRDDGMHDIKAILIGSGDGEILCRQYIKEHQLEKTIEIRKEVHHNMLPEIFNTFDLFVLPSYFEGFGCVFTEAAACGIPFMACKGQGATEYLSEDSIDKWTITPTDYRELAQKIKNYRKFHHPQKLIESYDINILIQRYLCELDEYSSLIQNNHTS